MYETGAIFGGESSAHYFYKSNGNAESQLITIMLILKLMSETEKPLSELAETVRRSHESGEFNFRVTNAPEIMDALKEKYKEGELLELDGIAITYPDHRFSVRTSNTEPLLRLNLESLVKETTEKKFAEIKSFIESMAKSE
jgi:phosphomannomutase